MMIDGNRRWARQLGFDSAAENSIDATSARAWFEQDAEDARTWLRGHGLPAD